MKVFSFDAETNGLWGKPFSIAAIVYENGEETTRFVGRCPIKGKTDSWVAENVLPQMEGIEETHKSYDELLADFAKFYLDNKSDADVIIHMGVPVESKVIIDMHSRGFIGDRDGPYPLIDVSSILKAKGFNPISVDSYNKEFDLMEGVPEAEGLATHHPLYDSIAAARAYMHLIG